MNYILAYLLGFATATPFFQTSLDLNLADTSPAVQNDMFTTSLVGCSVLARKHCCGHCVCQNNQINCHGARRNGDSGPFCDKVEDNGRRYGCFCATVLTKKSLICPKLGPTHESDAVREETKGSEVVKEIIGVLEAVKEKLEQAEVVEKEFEGLNSPPSPDIDSFNDPRTRVACPILEGWRATCCPHCTCNNGQIHCGGAKHNGKCCTSLFQGARRGCKCVLPQAKSLCPNGNHIMSFKEAADNLQPANMLPFIPLKPTMRVKEPEKDLNPGDLAAEDLEDMSPSVQTDLFVDQPVFCPLTYKKACCPYCTCHNGVLDCRGAKLGTKSCAAPHGTRNGCRCGNSKMQGLCAREDKIPDLFNQVEEL